MKESFDDGKLYDEDAQRFGPIVIQNFREVLRDYNYERYEARFRAMAKEARLHPSQRPKLNPGQFASLLERFATTLLASAERDSLANPKTQQAALRLLLSEDLTEDEDER